MAIYRNIKNGAAIQVVLVFFGCSLYAMNFDPIVHYQVPTIVESYSCVYNSIPLFEVFSASSYIVYDTFDNSSSRVDLTEDDISTDLDSSMHEDLDEYFNAKELYQSEEQESCKAVHQNFVDYTDGLKPIKTIELHTKEYRCPLRLICCTPRRSYIRMFTLDKLKSHLKKRHFNVSKNYQKYVYEDEINKLLFYTTSIHNFFLPVNLDELAIYRRKKISCIQLVKSSLHEYMKHSMPVNQQ